MLLTGFSVWTGFRFDPFYQSGFESFLLDGFTDKLLYNGLFQVCFRMHTVGLTLAFEVGVLLRGLRLYLNIPSEGLGILGV